jgi:tetratricopeptide (TPR) repeat protein
MTETGDPSQPSSGCRAVADYLDQFLQSGRVDRESLDPIAAHAGDCSRCYAELATFFRTAPRPDSSFLKETIDELADSLLNLARAIIRDRNDPNEEEMTRGLKIMDDGGGTAEANLEVGTEMIEEAEDFTGSSQIGGYNLLALRGLLLDAEQGHGLRTELALQIFRWAADLEGRCMPQAWNWVGALLYKRGQFEEAKAAFLSALSSKEPTTEVRSFVHCSLAYTYKQLKDLDRAVTSAGRSHSFARIDGKDPFFGLFVEAYTRALRAGADDIAKAKQCIVLLKELQEGEARLSIALEEAYNLPIREALVSAGVLLIR